MAWLDGWKYRVPVAVNNSVPAATVDVSIPIPGDWDLFWDTIDVLGEVDTNTVYQITGRFLEDSAHSTSNSDYTITLTTLDASYT